MAIKSTAQDQQPAAPVIKPQPAEQPPPSGSANAPLANAPLANAPLANAPLANAPLANATVLRGSGPDPVGDAPTPHSDGKPVPYQPPALDVVKEAEKIQKMLFKLDDYWVAKTILKQAASTLGYFWTREKRSATAERFAVTSFAVTTDSIVAATASGVSAGPISEKVGMADPSNEG